jgi:hypothetical protein
MDAYDKIQERMLMVNGLATYVFSQMAEQRMAEELLRPDNLKLRQAAFYVDKMLEELTEAAHEINDELKAYRQGLSVVNGTQENSNTSRLEST